jgi:hypothetical protein
VPGKKGPKKLNKTLLLSFDDALFDDLQKVSKENDNTSLQDIFRWTARAIVRCQKEFGTIPKDMRLVQALHPSMAPTAPSPQRFEMNEPPSQYSTSPADLAQIETEALAAELKKRKNQK